MLVRKEFLGIVFAIVSFTIVTTTRTKRMYAMCPPKFQRIGSECYYISTTKENWLDAHFDCKDRNSKLAEPIKFEDKRLRKYLMHENAGNGEKWIGGIYNWEKNKWQWGYNGRDIIYQSFSQMMPGSSQDLKFHCAVLNPDLKYRWSARSCVDKHFFICQHRMPYVSERNRDRIYTKWNETYPNEMANEIEVMVAASPGDDVIRNLRQPEMLPKRVLQRRMERRRINGVNNFNQINRPVTITTKNISNFAWPGQNRRHFDASDLDLTQHRRPNGRNGGGGGGGRLRRPQFWQNKNSTRRGGFRRIANTTPVNAVPSFSTAAPPFRSFEAVTKHTYTPIVDIAPDPIYEFNTKPPMARTRNEHNKRKYPKERKDQRKRIGGANDVHRGEASITRGDLVERRKELKAATLKTTTTPTTTAAATTTTTTTTTTPMPIPVTMAATTRSPSTIATTVVIPPIVHHFNLNKQPHSHGQLESVEEQTNHHVHHEHHKHHLAHQHHHPHHHYQHNKHEEEQQQQQQQQQHDTPPHEAAIKNEILRDNKVMIVEPMPASVGPVVDAMKVKRDNIRERLSKLTPEQQRRFFELRLERKQRRLDEQMQNENIIPKVDE